MAYNRQYTVADTPPGIARVHGVFAAGVRPSVTGDVLEDVLGGVFDTHGSLVTSSLQPRSDGRNGIAVSQLPFAAQTNARLSRAVFGGVAFDHFGHFLLETTARLWALPEFLSLPWLFLTHERSALKSYQLGFLELLGLPRDSVIAVPDAVAVDELIIPQASFTYHHHATLAYRDTFRRALLTPRDRPRRNVFVSRSRTTSAVTVGEHELEEVLAADGWEIVVPELLSPTEQALLFHEDNVVLGLQGSAMHLGLFAPPGRRVVHLCRGQAYRGYYVLDDLMAADATYFQAMRTTTLPPKPISGPFMLDLNATVAFLRDQGLIAPAGIATVIPTLRDAALETDYAAWWHYTESQTRFHRLIDHDGAAVAPRDALAPALQAVELRPLDSEIMAHAVVLLLKFEGPRAAASLLDRRDPGTIGTQPTDALLLHFRSIIEDARGDYSAALIAAERALAIAPTNASYVNQVATILFRLGRQNEAEVLLHDLVQRGEAIAINFHLFSIMRERDGDMPAALAAARHACELDRSDEELNRRLVDLLRRQDRPDEAWDAIAAFLDRGRGSVALLLQMAEHDRARGRAGKALEYLRRASRFEPDHREARQLLRAVLQELGLLPDLSGLGTLPNAALREQSVLIYRRSLALAEAGQVNEAVAVATIAAEMFPDNETIMQNLLGLMLRDGRTVEARMLAVSLIEHGRENGILHYLLSLIEYELGASPAAEAAARRAAELSPDNETIMQHFERTLPAG